MGDDWKPYEGYVESLGDDSMGSAQLDLVITQIGINDPWRCPGKWRHRLLHRLRLARWCRPCRRAIKVYMEKIRQNMMPKYRVKCSSNSTPSIAYSDLDIAKGVVHSLNSDQSDCLGPHVVEQRRGDTWVEVYR